MILRLIIISCTLIILHAESCPELYRRYSKNHTFCKPPKSSCKVVEKGVKKEHIKTILDEHNKYRSRIASGQETIGNLPQAADMLQMEWDDELAAVVQKHLDQCVYEHDCIQCHAVQNFPIGVGQNVYRKLNTRVSYNWVAAVKKWYDEVSDFKKQLVKKYSKKVKVNGKIGHFTQMIWAKSWKIGCGYTAFKSGDVIEELYGCNYGPTGNVEKSPIYETGNKCSNCPGNTKCGKDYPGLCKRTDQKKIPSYKPVLPKEGDMLFYCDFTDDYNCDIDSKKWKKFQGLSGGFATVTLKAGETAQMTVTKTFKAKKNLCLSFFYRSGANVDGDKVTGNRNLQIIDAATGKSNDVKLSKVSADFMKMNLPLNDFVGKDLKVGFEFSVPAGNPDQYFEVNNILAMEGKKC